MTTFLKDLIKRTYRKTHKLQDSFMGNLRVSYGENDVNKSPLKGPLLSGLWERSRGIRLIRVLLEKNMTSFEQP